MEGRVGIHLQRNVLLPPVEPEVLDRPPYLSPQFLPELGLVLPVRGRGRLRGVQRVDLGGGLVPTMPYV